MENAICLLYDMCRLCLDESGTHNLYENDRLIQDIFSCTGILQINCNDKLPPAICTNCMYKIEAAKDLREYATKNDTYMRSLLLKHNKNKYKIAKPKISVRPIEEVVSSSTVTENRTSKTKNEQQQDTDSSIMKKTNHTVMPKISVRSLADINSVTDFSAVTSSVNDRCLSVKDQTSPIKGQISLVKDHKSLAKDHTSTTKDDTSVVKDQTSSKRTRRSRSISASEKGDNNDYKCDMCKKTYQTSKKLYMHRRSHTKNLYCPLDACDKKFATKGDLQKHIRAHTGEKPYQCDLCDKSFAQNVTLKSHRETIHGAKIEIMET